MSSTETSTLVFKDQAGGYFLVPRDTLAQGRVPAAHTAEVERLIAESAATRSGEQDDAQGYFWPLIWAAEIAIGAAIIIGWSGPEVPPGPSTGSGGSSTPPRQREWTGRMQ